MSASPTTNPAATPLAAPVIPPKASDWSPLRNPVFRAMWIASAISYTGFEIRNYAAPLLMVDYQKVYGASPALSTLTVTASTLPIPLLVLFAGALADVLDRRKLLIVTHLAMMVVAILLGVLTVCGLMPPTLMLCFLFVIGAGYAMMNPTLLAVLPELVSPAEIRSALALNGLNMNIARVMGPLVGGLIVLICGTNHFYAGKGLAFMATGISLAGVIWVVYRWNPPQRKRPEHPETVLGAIHTGLRYTVLTPPLLAILARVFIFIVCAALVPVLAGVLCKKEPAAFHADLGAMIWMMSFGLGAILGVYQMQKLQRRFGIEEVVTVCTVGFGLAALAVAHTPNLYLGCLAMAAAGFSWVIVPTNFNISTQLAVPVWIKGRAMGMYVLVLWGAFAVGGAASGALLKAYGPRGALNVFGIGVLLGVIPILWLRLVPKHKLDFTPVKRALPTDDPHLADLARHDGPVAVTVDYRVRPDQAGPFRAAMRNLRLYRRRNGAVHWQLRGVERASGALTYRETYQFPSFADRARSNERITKYDVSLEEELLPLLADTQPPLVRHQPGDLAALTHRPLTAFLDGIAREFPKLLDRLENARRYGWEGKTRH